MTDIESGLTEHPVLDVVAERAMATGIKAADILFQASDRLKDDHPRLSTVSLRIGRGSLIAAAGIAEYTPPTSEELRGTAEAAIFFSRIAGRWTLEAIKEQFRPRCSRH